MLQHVGVVRLVEALRGCVIRCHVLQHLIQDAQTGVGDISHRVLECPYDRVKN